MRRRGWQRRQGWRSGRGRGLRPSLTSTGQSKGYRTKPGPREGRDIYRGEGLGPRRPGRRRLLVMTMSMKRSGGPKESRRRWRQHMQLQLRQKRLPRGGRGQRIIEIVRRRRRRKKPREEEKSNDPIRRVKL